VIRALAHSSNDWLIERLIDWLAAAVHVMTLCACMQSLRAIGEGATHATNPNLWVRQRYGKLYENFRPETSWWRMLLIFRKFLLAWATIMFNGNAMFQVRSRHIGLCCDEMASCSCPLALAQGFPFLKP
jgi:hypothetical protein